MVWGDKHTDENATKLLDKLDLNHDNKLSLSEFKKAEEKEPLLLEPAFTIQTNLKKRLFDDDWWKEKQKIRHMTLAPGASVVDLYYNRSTLKSRP